MLALQSGAMMAWLASDRGLLVVGTSLVLGGLGFVWVDCVRLWRVRRKTRDVVDVAATTVFTAMILGIALSLRTWDSLPVAAVGAALAALSYFCLSRFLRVSAIPVD